MTQPDMNYSSQPQVLSPGAVPRSGAQGTRNGKMGPLLTPAHQRMISLNASQALSPEKGAPTSAEKTYGGFDFERERNKMARFLQTKERSG